jgi:hypothetical protein
MSPNPVESLLYPLLIITTPSRNFLFFSNRQIQSFVAKCCLLENPELVKYTDCRQIICILILQIMRFDFAIFYILSHDITHFVLKNQE